MRNEILDKLINDFKFELSAKDGTVCVAFEGKLGDLFTAFITMMDRNPQMGELISDVVEYRKSIN